MKNLFLAVVAVLLLAGCDNGAKYKMVDGTIICQVPERQADQQDMIGYAAEPMEVVRVGFIGLGMRGPGAVRRWCQIDGTEIVALCDINPEGIAKSQKYIADAGRKPAVEDDEFRIRHHFQYLELSGGTLNDQAVHMMDICREVLQANPLYAMGHSSRKGVKCEYGNFNTNYQILYKYPEDINVMVQQTTVGAATGGVVARFFGENGTAEAKYSGGVFITGPNKWDSGIDNALGDADTNKGRSFIGSIISGNYINEIEAGCNSTLMAILGREAAAKGKTLTWNKLVKSNQRYGNQPDLSKF